MKNSLMMFLIVGSSMMAHAAPDSVICKVENPCAWQLSYGDMEGLGFCINQITGDSNAFYMLTSDEKNSDLLAQELKTIVLSETEIKAQSEDQSVVLEAHLNQVGSLTVNKKYGFFVFCEAK